VPRGHQPEQRVLSLRRLSTHLELDAHHREDTNLVLGQQLLDGHEERLLNHTHASGPYILMRQRATQFHPGDSFSLPVGTLTQTHTHRDDAVEAVGAAVQILLRASENEDGHHPAERHHAHRGVDLSG
jgi:hypothetical protein